VWLGVPARTALIPFGPEWHPQNTLLYLVKLNTQSLRSPLSYEGVFLGNVNRGRDRDEQLLITAFM
jgi:hypothetical protein